MALAEVPNTFECRACFSYPKRKQQSVLQTPLMAFLKAYPAVIVAHRGLVFENGGDSLHTPTLSDGHSTHLPGAAITLHIHRKSKTKPHA